jgi:hypothetical protein
VTRRLSPLKRMIAAVVLSLAVASVVAIAKPTAANAAGTTTIVGTALRVNTDGSTVRAPGTSMYLYYWNGSTWVSLGKQATANSSGNYSITVPSGWYYEVAGTISYGSCYALGYLANYLGHSVAFWTNPGQQVNAAVKMPFNRYIYC